MDPEIQKVGGPPLGTGIRSSFGDQKGEAQQLGLTFVAWELGPENGTQIVPPKWSRGTVCYVSMPTQNI